MFKHLYLSLFFTLFSSLLLAQQTINAGANINTLKSTAGVSTFDRDVFVNMHANYNGNDWKESELDYVHEDLGINFGRSVGGVTWQMNRLRENPNRAGFFDLDHMKELGEESRGWYAAKPFLKKYERQTDVLTSHISPTFPNGKPTNQGFAPDGYESIAQFYAYFLKEYYDENGKPKPRFLEVLNEPFVHANELNTTNAEISKFHAVVADSVHAHHDDVMVGGYTAAWPEFERNNFSIWDETWRTFIDIAGEKMDFFSVHLYDVPRPDTYSQRRGSNVEAILDMIEQYSLLKLGEVKPLVISEYGACCGFWDGEYYEERDWLQLESIPSITMSLMDRPNRVLKAIPFIVDKATWYLDNNGFQYPYVLLENRNGGSVWEYTHLVKYYELWRKVNGVRVDTWTDDPDLQIDAYVDDNTVYVLMVNLEDKAIRANFRISDITDNRLESIEVKHLFEIDDIPQLEKERRMFEPDAYEMGANATMVLEYTFRDVVELNQSLEESKHYADRYLQPIDANTPITFNLNNVAPPSYGKSVLRIGIGRAHDKSLQPSIRLNDVLLETPNDWKGYDQKPREDFFGVLELPVSNSLLQANNQVSITFPDDGGHISTVTMQVRDFDHDPRRTTVSTKKIRPDWAEDIVIYPNPASNQITIGGLDAISNVQIRIFDLNGRLVLENTTNQSQSDLNIEHLSQGLYQIQLRTVDGIWTKKLAILARG